MKKLLFIAFIFILGGASGLSLTPFFSEQFSMSGATDLPSEEVQPLYWVAPMDKNYRRDAPGLSPMGMDLVPVYRESNTEDAGVVKISPVVEHNLGIKTALVKRESLIRPIDTVGTVQFDESKIAHIHSRVEGWIEKLNISAAGDPVRKGQVLYELYSPALVNAQEEFLVALRSGNQNLIKASKSRLMSLGLDEKHTKRLKQRGKVDQRVQVFSEHDGVIIALNVRQGMHIKPSTEVLSIGSLDSVWVLGEVFERQSYLVGKGQDVEIELNGLPGKIWKGSVNYIYPKLDSTTRTLSIRVRIANPDHLLKPNMLVNLRVLNTSDEPGLSIPRQALIKAGQHSRVVKYLGDGQYKSVLVEVGFEGFVKDDLIARVQIKSGLKEGDQVVDSAQFLIDSESNIDAELARLESATQQDAEASSSDVSSARVLSSGKLNNIMRDMRVLNITHEPIPEWDWPVMKMDFQVAESVDLSALKVGETIQFSLEKTDDWDYTIVSLSSDPETINDHAENMADEMDHGDR